MRRLLSPAILLSVLVAPSIAVACPFCNRGPSGNAVKQEIFYSGSFWYFGVATVLPFVVCTAVIFWMSSRGGPDRSRRAISTSTVRGPS